LYKIYKLLFFILLNSALFGQTTYFISSSLGNDSNSGKSQSSPWKSLDKLHNSWNLIKPGDKILLKRNDVFRPTSISRNAIIQPPTGLSGNSSNYITIAAYGEGQKPIISSRLSGKKLIFATSLHYFVFENLQLRGPIEFNATYTGFTNLKFLHLDWDGNYQGDAAGGDINFISNFNEISPDNYNDTPIRNIEIGYCTFKNNSSNDILNMNAPRENIWIHNNKFFNAKNECLDIGGGNNITIEFNLFSGSNANIVKLQPQVHKMENLIIRGNLILGTKQFGLVVYNARNSKIYNNTIWVHPNAFGSARFGWATANPVYLSNVGTTGFDNNIIENNIFFGRVIFGQPDNVKITYRNGSTITYKRPPVWTNNLFKNNLYYDPTFDARISQYRYKGNTRVYWTGPGNTYGTVDDVSFNDPHWRINNFADWQSLSTTSAELQDNPQFINPYWNSAEDFGDFSLKASSFAINSGNQTSFSQDLFGNTIPQGMHPNRGAIQKLAIENSTLNLIEAYSINSNTVVLNFSKRVIYNTAVSQSNYSISGGVSVISASLSPEGKQVILKTSTHPSSNYFSITANNLRDIGGELISAKTSSYSFGTSTNTHSSNLLQNGSGDYEVLLGNWIKYGNNIISLSGDFVSSGTKSLKIEGINDSRGAYLYLNSSSGVLNNLVVGKTYRITFWAKTNNHNVKLKLLDAVSLLQQQTATITTEFKKHELSFVAKHSTLTLIRFEELKSGQLVYFDNLQILDSAVNPPPPPAPTNDLFITGRGNFEINVGSWVGFGNNVLQISTEYAKSGTRSLKITNINDHRGAYLYFNSASDLITNLTPGKIYKVSFWAKTSSSTAKIRVQDAVGHFPNYVAHISSSPVQIEIEFTASNSTMNYLRLEGMQTNQSVYIDNLQFLSGESGNINNPTLSNLFEGSKGGYESNIGSWKKYGNNSFQTSSEYSSSGSRSLKVSFVNNHAGGYLYLNKSYDLSTDLVVGKQYILTFWARTNSGSAKVMVRDAMKGIQDYSAVVTNSPKKYEIVFNATNEIYNYLKFDGLSSGQSIYIDDLELYDLSESNNRPSSNNNPLGKMQLDLNGELTNGEVKLSWKNLGDDIVNYEVQRTNSEVEENWTSIKSIVNTPSEKISLNDKPASGSYIYRIKYETNKGSFELSNEVTITVVPETFELFQNYPNPFNPSTKIKFAIPSQSKVYLAVYNILGEQIAILNNEMLEAGTHELIWNASLLPSGTYLLKINAESLNGEQNYSEVKKMMLIK
jgi:hypothetical protein